MTGLYTKLAGLCPENAVLFLRRNPVPHLPDRQVSKILGKKISETPSGHHIYTYKYDRYHGDNGDRYNVFKAYNPENNKIDMRVSTKNKPDSPLVHDINALNGRKGSTLKAHDFYHHLITHHGLTLRTDEQTQAGKKVWHKLSQKPDISMHGLDPIDNKIYKVDPNDDKTTHRDGNKDNDTEHDKFIRRLNLVAHAKTPKISLKAENQDKNNV